MFTTDGDPGSSGLSAGQTQLELLVVEDDVLEGRLLEANLGRRGGVRVHVAGSVGAALAWLEAVPVDAVLTDLMLPDGDGIELVRHIRAGDPGMPVVVLTAHGSLERAVEGIRAGATDFLAKPANIDAVLALIERAVRERPLREEVSRLMVRRAGASAERYLVGDHARLDDARRFATRVATIPNARVLITGESGTGKSLLARAIHDLSGARGRFIEVNCSALPANLLESELFGHEKGAFTGATERKRGLIEMASHGTLLLDEIGAMPLDLQAKLLLFLESQQIRRVGATTQMTVEARVVAATNEDLQARVRDGGFRLDLLYRLDVASYRMPALREMGPVIPELAAHFVAELSRGFGRAPVPIAQASVDAIRRHDWPGNARELRNVLERALIFHDGGPLDVDVPSPHGRTEQDGDGAGIALAPGLPLEQVERRYIEATLAANPNIDLDTIARQLGISRKTLWEKRKRWAL